MVSKRRTERRSEGSREPEKTAAKYFDDFSPARAESVQALTLRQIQILNCIEESYRASGVGPTRRELLVQLGIRSFRALREHLEYLAAKGFIRLDDDTTRGIAVLIPSSEARLKVALPGLAKTRAAKAIGKVGT